MKLSFLFAAFLSLPVWVCAQGIKFETGTWEQVKEKAKAENKPIFVDAFTTWCGPCKHMTKNIFSLTNVGDFFNQKYISFAYDMEKGAGVDFAAKYKVFAFPTLLYFDSNGELVHRTVGASGADELLTTAKNALDPQKQYYTLYKQYQNGKQEPEFLSALVAVALDAGEQRTALKAFETYWGNLSDEQKKSNEAFTTLSSVAPDMNSPLFDYVVANRSGYEQSIGKEKVQTYIDQAFDIACYQPLMRDNLDAKKDFPPILAKFKKIEPKNSKYWETKLNYVYYNTKFPATKEAQKYKATYLDKYSKDWSELNEAAWHVFEDDAANSKTVKKALGWAEKSVKINRNFYNLDTQAHLLNRTGKSKDAIAPAEEAIKLGKAAGADVSGTETLLETIKAK